MMTTALPARLSRSRNITGPRLVLALLILVYFGYFGLYATRRYLAFETGAFDLGVYVQPLWNFIQGRNFAVSLIEDNGPLRWATHVEPILFFIAPLYMLWPDPRTLLWVQVAGLSLAALPLYGLAARRLQQEWAALVVVLAFFLMPATESVTLFDFHAVTLAPLFLFAALYFLDLALAAQGKSLWMWPEAGQSRSKNRAQAQDSPGLAARPQWQRAGKLYCFSGLFFLLALSTKEDISLHVFMIGLYLLALRGRRWEGGSLMAVGLAWFYVTFQVIIPAFRTAGGQSIYTAWFETLGHTPLEIALSPLTAPDKVLALIFRPGSIPALGMLTVPQALLPLVGLPFLLMAAPSMAFSLLSQNPTLRQLETWHYAAPMLPFVMLATIDGLARLACYLPRLTRRFWRPVSGRVVLAGAAAVLLLVSLGYHHLRGYSHLSKLPEWPQVTAHHRLGQAIAAAIPANASVLAQAQLVPYVAHREQLAIWSGPLLTGYTYIWLDLSHPRMPNRFNAHGNLLTGLVIEPAFGPVVAADGYLLLKKGAGRVPLAEELFTFTAFDRLPSGVQPVEALFGNALRLVAVKPEVRRLATSETEPQMVLFFETIRRPVEEYFLFVYLLDKNGAVIGATDYPQPALVWWPISRWQPGNRRQVRVNTVPWWTGDKPVFGYALALSRRNDPWDVSARLPITIPAAANNPPGSRPIEQNTLLPVAAFKRFAGLAYPQPLTAIRQAERGE